MRASKIIPKCTVLGPYPGDIISVEEAEKLRREKDQDRYIFEFQNTMLEIPLV